MARTKTEPRQESSLNVFVSSSTKRSLVDLSREFDRPVAEVVRTILKFGLPVLRGIWEGERSVFADLARRSRRAKRRSTNRGEDLPDKDS